jgi:non-canonical purine NTP pyrophosphatase (RdgB/HAM1 family)
MSDLITFVTGNQHKANNMARFLGIEIDHQKLDLDEIQSNDLEEIIEHKVKQAYELIKCPVIVDDISMGLDELNNLPGPFVKFFLQAPDGAEKICRMADGLKNRNAKAHCVIGYYDGHNLKIFKGTITGVIARHSSGKGGYGWDSIFCPEGYGGKTRSELNESDYEEVYRKIRPLAELKAFLTSR